ncbi:hypothetical protein FACS1894145_8200 [Bacteroidia bacterium]|nr:hypothetical protein FACS1894145_8200 [Bacteroidia bacterium]
MFQAELEYLVRHCEGDSPKQSDENAGLLHFVRNGAEIEQMPLFELISYFYRLYDLPKIKGQAAYLFFFFDAINQYLKNSSADLHSFISFWDKELSKRTIPTGAGIDGIRAMTIHKSKGLQFPTVLLPYCTWELNPKKNPEQLRVPIKWGLRLAE